MRGAPLCCPMSDTTAAPWENLYVIGDDRGDKGDRDDKADKSDRDDRGDKGDRDDCLSLAFKQRYGLCKEDYTGPHLLHTLLQTSKLLGTCLLYTSPSPRDS